MVAATEMKDEDAKTVVDVSDDDEIEPAKCGNSAVKSSSGMKHFDHDSDDNSYLSECSEDNLTTAGATESKEGRDSSSDDDSDTEDPTLCPKSSEHEMIPRSFIRNCSRVSERSSLQEVRVTQVESTKGLKNNNLPWQQYGEVLGNESADADLDVSTENSKVMAAALAAAIPSDDDSFSDDSDNGSLRATSGTKSVSVFTRSSNSETSKKMMPSLVEIPASAQRPDSDNGSSLSSDESESSIFDDEKSDNEPDEEKRPCHNAVSRKDSRNLLVKDISWSEGDDLGGNERKKKVKQREISTDRPLSFSGSSSTFRWSDVKSKIFYSFRLLKGSSESGEDGSRTISVKNLAREVTHDTLYDFFRGVGNITNVRITKEAGRAGLGSAYVEFESGAHARKAVQMSGKNMNGRIIRCDIAYERETGSVAGSTQQKQQSQASREIGSASGSSHGKQLHSEVSKGTGSVSGSSHGKQRQELKLSRSDSAPSSGKGSSEKQSALKMFDPELQDGDAKFLSRFNYPPNAYVYNSHLSPGYSQPVNLRKDRKSGGCRDIVVASPRSDGKPLTAVERARPFVDKSIHPCEQKRAKGGSKTAWPWKRWRKKSKWARLFWPWTKSRLQWWQFAKLSPSKFARGKGCNDYPRKETMQTSILSVGNNQSVYIQYNSAISVADDPSNTPSQHSDVGEVGHNI